MRNFQNFVSSMFKMTAMGTNSGVLLKFYKKLPNAPQKPEKGVPMFEKQECFMFGISHRDFNIIRVVLRKTNKVVLFHSSGDSNKILTIEKHKQDPSRFPQENDPRKYMDYYKISFSVPKIISGYVTIDEADYYHLMTFMEKVLYSTYLIDRNNEEYMKNRQTNNTYSGTQRVNKNYAEQEMFKQPAETTQPSSSTTISDDDEIPF